MNIISHALCRSLSFNSNNQINNCTKLLKRFAGSSHWQNVKGTKEANDKVKNTNVSIIKSLITNAIKVGNGIRDPKLNSSLASVLLRAKEMSVRMSSIEKMLKDSEMVEPYIIEYHAPGGIVLLVETVAKHAEREKQLIQSTLKKYGFKPAQSFLRNRFYSHRGYVRVAADPSLIKDDDSAVELALEADAEEVHRVDDDSDSVVYKFSCQPSEIQRVQAYLKSKGLDVVDYFDSYDVVEQVVVNEEASESIKMLCDKLYDSFENVERVFINTKFEKQ